MLFFIIEQYLTSKPSGVISLLLIISSKNKCIFILYYYVVLSEKNLKKIN